jgi:Fur family transcriptional regulator, ferric uptake regulator
LTRLEAHCIRLGIRLTAKQRKICQTLSELNDHPDAENIVAEVALRYPGISRGTVYRTLKFLEEEGALLRHQFGTRAARYEEALSDHYHLIDTCTGRISEFKSEKIGALSRHIAAERGYKLSYIKLELYGVPGQTVRQTVSETVDDVEIE